MTALFTALWSRIGPWIVAAGALVATIGAFGATQRRAGRQDAEAEATRQTLHQAETRHEIDDAVRRAGPGAAERLRRQWSRD